MNYSELLLAIKQYLNRTDLDDVLPTFILLTEARMNRVIRCRSMEKSLTYSHDAQFKDLPADFLEARNIQANTNPVTPLQYVTPQEADRIRAMQITGAPRYFTILNNQIELVPFQVTDVEIVYYGKIPALTSDAPTNWLATRYPDIYLHGCLVQAATYLKDDPSTWVQFYDTAISELTVDDERSRFQGTTPQVRGITIG